MKFALMILLVLSSLSAFAAKVPRAKLEVYNKCRGTLDDFGINLSCASLEDPGSHWVIGGAGHRPFHGKILRIDQECRYSSFEFVNYDNVNTYYENHESDVRVRLSHDQKKIEEVTVKGRPTGSSERVRCVEVE